MCDPLLLYHHMIYKVLIILAIVKYGTLLQNVRLEIIPKVVQRGHNVTLRCHYDLEGAPLYSVKWYRGSHEFYRFSPNEMPTTKIFPFSNIHVDLSQSNAKQVILRQLDFSFSGNYSCEVTTDAPKFSTAFVTDQMFVVVLPKKLPVIKVNKDLYFPGDTLHANCTSMASKPITNLTFLLNNRMAGVTDTKVYQSQNDSSLMITYLSLHVDLFPSYFIGKQLILKCTAQIPMLYDESVEVNLSNDYDLNKNRDPILERGTKNVMSSSTSFAPSLLTTPNPVSIVLIKYIFSICLKVLNNFNS